MEEDADFTHLLAQAAEAPEATPDTFRDVLVRHRRGRTRALVAALAAVALVGPAVGIAVGRATADHSTRVATGGPPPASGASSSTGSVGSVTESHSSAAAGPLPWSQPPAPRRLFVRTTADGVTIRAYLQENLPSQGESRCASDQGEVPCPLLPPECSPPGSQLQAGLSDDGAVYPGFVPVTTADLPGPLVMLGASYFGVMEGDPAAWAAVKADAGVAQVRVHFADGATDEMAPVDGYAVFAHRTAAPAPPPVQTGPAPSPEAAEAIMKAQMPQGSAEAVDGAGAVLSTVDLTSATGSFSAHCAMADEPGMMPSPGGGMAPPAPPAAATATTRP